MSVRVEDDPPYIEALVNIYDDKSRKLSKELTRTFQNEHNISLTSLHIHPDHASCMEVSILKSATDEIGRLAEPQVSPNAACAMMIPD